MVNTSYVFLMTWGVGTFFWARCVRIINILSVPT